MKRSHVSAFSHSSIVARESKVAENNEEKEAAGKGISTKADVTLQSTRRKMTKL